MRDKFKKLAFFLIIILLGDGVVDFDFSTLLDEIILIRYLGSKVQLAFWRCFAQSDTTKTKRILPKFFYVPWSSRDSPPDAPVGFLDKMAIN